MPRTRTQQIIQTLRDRPKTAVKAGVCLLVALGAVVYAAVAVPHAAWASTEIEKVRHEFVAGVDIALPVLNGFEEVLGRSAEFDRLMSKFVLPDNRMLAFYISDTDMARMAEGSGESFRKYLIVQTVKQGVFLDGGVSFDSIKKSFRDEMADMRPQDLPEVGDVIRDANEYIGSTYKTDMKMEIGENRSKGIFAESDDYIGFLNLSSLAIETAQGKKEYPAAVAMMAVNVRGRLILVYSYYSNYAISSDIDFVQNTAQTYAKLLLDANAGGDTAGSTGRKIILIVLFMLGVVIAGALLANRFRSQSGQDQAQ